VSDVKGHTQKHIQTNRKLQKVLSKFDESDIMYAERMKMQAEISSLYNKPEVQERLQKFHDNEVASCQGSNEPKCTPEAIEEAVNQARDEARRTIEGCFYSDLRRELLPQVEKHLRLAQQRKYKDFGWLKWNDWKKLRTDKGLEGKKMRCRGQGCFADIKRVALGDPAGVSEESQQWPAPETNNKGWEGKIYKETRRFYAFGSRSAHLLISDLQNVNPTSGAIEDNAEDEGELDPLVGKWKYTHIYRVPGQANQLFQGGYEIKQESGKLTFHEDSIEGDLVGVLQDKDGWKEANLTNARTGKVQGKIRAQLQTDDLGDICVTRVYDSHGEDASGGEPVIARMSVDGSLVFAEMSLTDKAKGLVEVFDEQAYLLKNPGALQFQTWKNYRKGGDSRTLKNKKVYIDAEECPQYQTSCAASTKDGLVVTDVSYKVLFGLGTRQLEIDENKMTGCIKNKTIKLKPDMKTKCLMIYDPQAYGRATMDGAVKAPDDSEDDDHGAGNNEIVRATQQAMVCENSSEAGQAVVNDQFGLSSENLRHDSDDASDNASGSLLSLTDDEIMERIEVDAIVRLADDLQPPCNREMSGSSASVHHGTI
jgi:hypothetical protein